MLDGKAAPEIEAWVSGNTGEIPLDAFAHCINLLQHATNGFQQSRIDQRSYRRSAPADDQAVTPVWQLVKHLTTVLPEVHRQMLVKWRELEGQQPCRCIEDHCWRIANAGELSAFDPRRTHGLKAVCDSQLTFAFRDHFLGVLKME